MKELVLTVQRRQYDHLGDPISLDDLKRAVEVLGGDIFTIHSLSEDYEVRFRLWVSSIEQEEE